MSKAINVNDSFTYLYKPFLLLAGISGVGKTRFVRAQAACSNGWTADDPRKPDNYELVAVRPDWHEPSDLLGYVSRIDGTKYVPTGFLKFLVKAWQEVFDNSGSLTDIGVGIRPFWLCLDEMNLAPVEQYFADYLSILESRKWTDTEYSSLPIISDDLELVMKALKGGADEDLWSAFISNGGIPLPPNLIVAGTVNMDETTHGFSRKVIDRALTLDFQEFFPNRFNEFFVPQTEPKILSFYTASHVSSPGDLSDVLADPNGDKSITFLSEINIKLKSTPFELAYRALNELLLSVKCFMPEDNQSLVAVWDDYLMQKVLPRIEGDAEKLRFTGDDESSLLNELSKLIKTKFKRLLETDNDIITRPDLFNQKVDGDEAEPCRCKSLDKISWMQERLVQNHYTSFWA
ncbi:restriction endonuclease [Oceanispirochaeta crateris]|uniref:Restriction endonuclease n=2 Tax=Oceanispirochaeta crateris TaxID=2518645 RepID=A0A5C1QUU4_9SPIO|nr:restriction endonuclease [Oceanispirochaeta crateris]